MANINRKHRRGLSSVVGAVFMILVMLGALNVILLALQQQDKVTQAVVEKSNSSLGKLNEEISISDIKVTGNNKLNMTVTNSGGATAKLASLYVVNETARQQLRYDLNNDPLDGRASKNVGTDLALDLKSNTKYSVKVVTAAGNTATSGITPVSQAALPMSLYVIPPTVSPGNNVSLLFTVTNNITDSTLGWAVTPYIQPPTCGGGCTLTLQESPSSAIIPRGNTALFKWKYLVSTSNALEHTMTFNASLVNAKQGNFVIENGLAKLVDGAQISYQSEIIISNDLIQKPEIFLLIPGPNGDTDNDAEQALWGIVVVNPTNQTMNVTRVVLNTYSSLTTASQSMISTVANCQVTDLVPINPASGWTCPHDNMIEWKYSLMPQAIDGYSVDTFLFRYHPGDLNQDEPSFMVSVSVFTSLGQFTRTGLSSSMRDGAGLSALNVYLTDTTNEGDAEDNVHMFGHMNGFSHDTEITLNVAAADLDTDSATYIGIGAKLIINVPRGFSEVEVDSAGSNGFLINPVINEPKVIGYADGTIQIVATTNAALGDVNQKEAFILSLTTKTPIVNGTKVYIMHTLMDATAYNGLASWPAGPTAQIALQVCSDLDNYCG